MRHLWPSRAPRPCADKSIAGGPNWSAHARGNGVPEVPGEVPYHEAPITDLGRGMDQRRCVAAPCGEGRSSPCATWRLPSYTLLGMVSFNHSPICRRGPFACPTDIVGAASLGPTQSHGLNYHPISLSAPTWAAFLTSSVRSSFCPLFVTSPMRTFMTRS